MILCTDDNLHVPRDHHSPYYNLVGAIDHIWALRNGNKGAQLALKSHQGLPKKSAGSTMSYVEAWQASGTAALHNLPTKIAPWAPVNISVRC